MYAGPGRPSPKEPFAPRSPQAGRGSPFHQARLEDALRRLQQLRTPYRFYVLKFSERISEALTSRVLEGAAAHAYHIRIDEQTFGVLDIAGDHQASNSHDAFLQGLLRKLEKQYRQFSGASWLPVAVDYIEGRTDEINGVEDMLLLAASRNRKEAGDNSMHSSKESGQQEYRAFA
ncbi:hypothetical protein ACFOW6_07260 [Fodinicurvata halophila]|uniref:Uncharacterized protein n=1 Tax=Fodinicurvata halophila TaxID=1419723 RepID=A0ABV8UJ83_9PROT